MSDHGAGWDSNPPRKRARRGRLRTSLSPRVVANAVYPDFKVSNTPPGTRQTQRTPGTPDPHNRKDRST